MTTYYTTAAKVYATSGISSTQVSEANVNEFIEDACDEIDRLCNTTFWVLENSGTASAGASTTLTDSGIGWTADAYIGSYVWVYGGTGIGQIREITDNTTEILTVDRAWDTNPDSTSTYRILATNPNTDPYISELTDGTGTDLYYLNYVPLLILEAVTIDSTSVTPSYLYQYKNEGKLMMKDDAEVTTFKDNDPQTVDLDYWYGVYPIPRIVERYCTIVAALRALSAQIGGTFDDVTSFSVPHMTGSLGEPYTNIRETMKQLREERDRIKISLPIYLAIGSN